MTAEAEEVLIGVKKVVAFTGYVLFHQTLETKWKCSAPAFSYASGAKNLAYTSSFGAFSGKRRAVANFDVVTSFLNSFQDIEARLGMGVGV